MKRTSLKLLAIIPLMGFAISAQAYTTTTSSSTDGTGSTTNDRTRAGKVETSNTVTTTSAPATNSPSVLDQSSGTTQDVEVTRMIREELSKSSGLSTSAKNVEVITLNNTVTLRGAVATQAERTQVVRDAQRAAGNRAIRNELTVDTTRR